MGAALLGVSLAGLIGVALAVVLVRGLSAVLVQQVERWRGRPLELRVTARHEFTRDLFEVSLARPGFPWPLPSARPGQYLTLMIPEGSGVRRSYSLAAWTRWPRSYRLAIKREADGRGSGWLYRELQPGTPIRALRPAGSFVLEAMPDRDVILVGAGIGVTPIRAMLHAAVAMPSPRRSRRIIVVHQARERADLCYEAELQALAEQHAAIAYHPILSRPDRQWTGTHGRLDARMLLSLIPRPRDSDVYFCGPDAMGASLLDGLVRAGCDAHRFRSESFGAGDNPDATAYAVAVSGFPPFSFCGEPSLLHALERQGVSIRRECGAGSCGSCRVRVIRGSVLNRITPDAPLCAGEALACCCVPREDLVLQLYPDRKPARRA